jgi:hypothetical protein
MYQMPILQLQVIDRMQKIPSNKDELRVDVMIAINQTAMCTQENQNYDGMTV